MDFIFRRKSTDAGESGNPPLGMLRGSALRSSLSEGTSKIFSSVVAKKNGLMSDISSKVDSVLGGKDDEDEREEIVDSARDKRDRMRELRSTKTLPNGSVRPNGNEAKAHSNTSFDEPMHRRESKESIAEKKDPMEKTEPKIEQTLDERDPNDPPFRIRRHSIVDDVEYEQPYRRESIADDFGFTSKADESPEQVEEDFTEEAKDLVPQEPLDVAQRRGEIRKIIHAMGDLISFDEDAFGGGSSSNSEYGDGEDPVYERSPSVCSDKSWTSAESLLDEFSAECKEFMRIFVEMMFKKEPIMQIDKARFGELAQHGPGRVWFARCVNTQRCNSKRVDEDIFYQLVQYFAVVLFECHEAEDFSPAKNLMNMCFTFYYEAQHGTRTKYKHFLYSYLKDQPIWESLRFWNAAFFDAVQSERCRKPVCTSRDQREERTTDKEFQENITFGQLGTFTCNMRAFGLSKDLCLQFLKKQSTIANLREEQVNMLRENVEKWRE